MQTSPTITKVAAALLKAQSEMGNASKDAINPFFKKSYADLNAIREAVLPALNKNGISAIQPTCIIDGVDYVETVLLHESGEYISSLTRIVVDKMNDAQRHGSGLSYARRYALQSIVNIGAEDDDAQKAVLPAKKEAAPAAPATTPPTKAQIDKAISQLGLATDRKELKKVIDDIHADIKANDEFKAKANARHLELAPATPSPTA